ncbi:hypothetical protein SAMN05880590_1422 [Rhizobium sp. RU35A]|nr:hypothetical protein SAMN05880590_1422 [Rhizobium sp. RU35A]
MEALLRKAAERTVTGLWDRIGKPIDLIEHQEVRNFFTYVVTIQHDGQPL